MICNLIQKLIYLDYAQKLHIQGTTQFIENGAIAIGDRFQTILNEMVDEIKKRFKQWYGSVGDSDIGPDVVYGAIVKVINNRIRLRVPDTAFKKLSDLVLDSEQKDYQIQQNDGYDMVYFLKANQKLYGSIMSTFTGQASIG